MNDRPVKVCFVMPKTYPLFNPEVEALFGGAEVDFYILATELAKDTDFDVSFVVADYGQPPIETRQNVRIISSLDFKNSPLSGGFKIYRAMRKAKADIYIFETASMGVFLGAVFCVLHRRKLIYRTAHIRECDGSYLKDNLIKGKLFNWSLKRTAQLIVQNQQDRELVRQTYGIDSVAIPNAHKIPEINNMEKESILWVGRSGKAKGARRFIDLAKSFPHEKFVMICQQATGDEKYKQLLKEAHTAANLEFIKRVGFHEIDKYFAAAKVFVNTSDSEGFPNTFIQACKAAAPILSYAVNPDEFLTRHLCGMACEADFEKLRRGLSFLLEDRRYMEIGQNGRKYVEQNHDIKKIVKTYKDLFRKIAGK